MVLDARHDPMGAAIADYFKNGIAGRLRVMSSLFDEDEMPVDHLFREVDEMNEIEQTALKLSQGKTLDVGAGSGCHSLALQEKGLSVTAIDVSPLSVEVMKESGIDDVRLTNFYDPSFCEQYDTILMLMNGSGFIGKIQNMPQFFNRIDQLLTQDGQVLLDSSDLIFLFEDENGIANIDLSSNYYGEVDYTMQYKNIKGHTFDWLYVDFDTLTHYAEQNGFKTQLILQGEHYDYLAKITRQA